MKYLSLFLLSFNCYALDQYAQTKTLEALLKVPEINNTKKYTEKRFYKTVNDATGITKKQLTFALALGSLKTGEIDTQKFLKLKINKNNLDIIPNLKYNYITKQYDSGINLTLGY